MFWILFVALIFIGCAVAWLAEFFQQMKTSEYEAVRVAYWTLVVMFWVSIIIWLNTLQGDQVGKTGRGNKQGDQVEKIDKIGLASLKKYVIYGVFDFNDELQAVFLVQRRTLMAAIGKNGNSQR